MSSVRSVGSLVSNVPSLSHTEAYSLHEYPLFCSLFLYCLDHSCVLGVQGSLVSDVFQKGIRPESFFVLVHNLGTADVCFYRYFLAEVIDNPRTELFLFLAPDRIPGQ